MFLGEISNQKDPSATRKVMDEAGEPDGVFTDTRRAVISKSVAGELVATALPRYKE